MLRRVCSGREADQGKENALPQRLLIRTKRVDMIKDSKHLLGVYSIVSDEGGRDLWVENGYATQHADGRGFDLTLRALPLDSKLVLREPFDEPSKEQSQDSGALSLAS
jgi:hypothetical protein